MSKFYLTRGLAFLFSTLIHEISHFVVALILNGHPKWFTLNLFPTYDHQKGGYLLGGVEVRNITWYNAVPISMSPFLLIPAALFLMYITATHLEDFAFIRIISLLVFSSLLLLGSIPSRQDWKIAMSNKKGMVFYLLILGSFIYLFLYV